MTASSREQRIQDTRSIIPANRRAEDKETDDVRARNCCANSCDQKRIPRRTVASPVHVETHDSMTAPDPVVPADHRRCRATNNKDSTHSVQGRARHLSLGGCARPRARTSHMVRSMRARASRNPGRYISRKVITRLPRSLGIANYVCMCMCVRAHGYGSCVRNDGHYVYRIRIMERSSKRIRLRYQGRLRMTVAIDVALWAWNAKWLFRKTNIRLGAPQTLYLVIVSTYL